VDFESNSSREVVDLWVLVYDTCFFIAEQAQFSLCVLGDECLLLIKDLKAFIDRHFAFQLIYIAKEANVFLLVVLDQITLKVVDAQTLQALFQRVKCF